MSKKIDRQVAKVLGIPYCTHSGLHGTVSPEASRSCSAPIGSCWSCFKYEARDYSTDIASAIGALEEFCKVNKRRWQLGSHDRHWCAVYNPDIKVEESFTQHYAASIPEAICTAILATNAILTAAPKVGDNHE